MANRNSRSLNHNLRRPCAKGDDSGASEGKPHEARNLSRIRSFQGVSTQPRSTRWRHAGPRIAEALFAIVAQKRNSFHTSLLPLGTLREAPLFRANVISLSSFFSLQSSDRPCVRSEHDDSDPGSLSDRVDSTFDRFRVVIATKEGQGLALYFASNGPEQNSLEVKVEETTVCKKRVRALRVWKFNHNRRESSLSATKLNIFRDSESVIAKFPSGEKRC